MNVPARPSRGAPDLRHAAASGELRVGRACLQRLRDGRLREDRAFATARLAGIAAAGRADEVALLCPAVRLEGVRLSFGYLAHGVRVRADASAAAAGGLEMAALAAVSAACLTLFDLLRAYDNSLAIGPLRLEAPASRRCHAR